MLLPKIIKLWKYTSKLWRHMWFANIMRHIRATNHLEREPNLGKCSSLSWYVPSQGASTSMSSSCQIFWRKYVFCQRLCSVSGNGKTQLGIGWLMSPDHTRIVALPVGHHPRKMHSHDYQYLNSSAGAPKQGLAGRYGSSGRKTSELEP